MFFFTSLCLSLTLSVCLFLFLKTLTRYHFMWFWRFKQFFNNKNIAKSTTSAAAAGGWQSRSHSLLLIEIKIHKVAKYFLIIIIFTSANRVTCSVFEMLQKSLSIVFTVQGEEKNSVNGKKFSPSWKWFFMRRWARAPPTKRLCNFLLFTLKRLLIRCWKSRHT